MVGRRGILALVGGGVGIIATVPAGAVTPEQAAAEIKGILERYQAEHRAELLGFELIGGDHERPPMIRSLWKNAREVVRFYHGAAHEQLKKLFGQSPLPAHSAEQIEQLRGRLDGTGRVQVTNILTAPIRNIIEVLEENSEGSESP